jgi:hypothetical protein
VGDSNGDVAYRRVGALENETSTGGSRAGRCGHYRVGRKVKKREREGVRRRGGAKEWKFAVGVSNFRFQIEAEVKSGIDSVIRCGHRSDAILRLKVTSCMLNPSS